MKTRTTFLIFWMILSLLGPSEPVSARWNSQFAGQEVSGLIVKWKNSAAAAGNALSPQAVDELSRAAGTPLRDVRAVSGGARLLGFEKPLSADEARTAAARIAHDQRVESVDPDWEVTAFKAPPNDPYYISNAWNLYSVRADHYGINVQQAWNVTTGDPALRVAVLDGGILADHEDLVGRTAGGYDFISNPADSNDGDGRDGNPADPGDFGCGEISSWHGTHVSGIIGAAGNNGKGIAGINWQSVLMPVRVLGTCRKGTTSDIVDAIRWSVGMPIAGVPVNPHPARVINMSFGCEGYHCGACPAVYQMAINDALQRGAVLVASAGNQQMDASQTFPANCTGVITVGATTKEGRFSYISNFGTTVSISAPGGSNNSTDTILSTMDTSADYPDADWVYKGQYGTSPAAAHVSGVVSLMLSVNPALSKDLVLMILRHTATPFPEVNPAACPSGQCGAGILNAGEAVEHARDLKILLGPTTFAPAFIGQPGNPWRLHLFIQPGMLAPDPVDYSVKVGEAVAQVETVNETEPGLYEVTVLPPVQAKPGKYDLLVKVKGGPVVLQEDAVQYGLTAYLPFVRK